MVLDRDAVIRHSGRIGGNLSCRGPFGLVVISNHYNSGQALNRNVIGRILDQLAGGKTQSDVVPILGPVGILVGGGDGDIRNNRILKIRS